MAIPPLQVGLDFGESSAQMGPGWILAWGTTVSDFERVSGAGASRQHNS